MLNFYAMPVLANGLQLHQDAASGLWTVTGDRTAYQTAGDALEAACERGQAKRPE